MDLNHKENLIHKADVLMEALPYIQQFRDSIAVIKFGGSAMEDPELTARTMRDIVLLEAIGMKVVVVHGGGKAITARLKELNIETRFVNSASPTPRPSRSWMTCSTIWSTAPSWTPS